MKPLIGMITKIGAGKRMVRLWVSAILLIGFFLLAACSAVYNPVADDIILSPTDTLLPAYIATDQNAQAGARATQVAAQAAVAEASVAQAYLLVTQTSVSIAMTSAAATEQHFTRQTEQVISQTRTAQSMEATATQQAYHEQITSVAQTQASENLQSTRSAAIQQTATAWHQTAVPLAATHVAIGAQIQDTERRVYWQQYVIPFWVFNGAFIFMVILTLLVTTYRKLLPAVDLRLRTRYGMHGETLILLDKSHPVNVLQPGRNFGAALLNRTNDVQVSGMAPGDPEWQDRVTGREQAVQLTKALPPYKRKSALRLLAKPEQLGQSQAGKITPEVRVLPPEDPNLRSLLDEAERKLLGEGNE